MIAESSGEPPLRWLRRRVARAQKLTEQLKEAATELAAVEMRLESLSANSEEGHGYRDAAVAVEAPRLRVQRERKLAACESLKKELEAMNATSGLFPEQQLAEIRLFAARVIKKKAYRKRAKQRRRAEASIRRAVAWDSYIVFPQTPGASTIPPHFVPPPSTPSPKWTMYAFPSVAK
ncbi:Stomatin protein [Phytophthora cinnamomi]|uniref:Stomatin protein n=1 Tax=Phytophthora cinnamomi TaxID=4785 RepID=UPI00355AB051|nr:Stomatin protein [Phytophthora cinnamomi]